MCGRGLPDTDILVNTSIKDEFIKQEVVCWFLLESPQHGHKVGEKKFPKFLRLFQSHNCTFPEVILSKILAIWHHLGRCIAIFSSRMHRNGYFS